MKLSELEIADGKRVTFKGLLQYLGIGKTTNGSYYLDLYIVDGTMEIRGKLWGVDIDKYTDEEISNSIDRMYEFTGTLKKFNNSITLSCEEMVAVEDNKTEYKVNIDIQYYKNIIKSVFGTMDLNSIYYKIANRIYQDCSEEFDVAVGAMSIHHNYPGGLLQHMATMLQIAYNICSIYSELDWNLIASAIILHDLGKLQEYKTMGTSKIEVTSEGSLLGHLFMGSYSIMDTAKVILNNNIGEEDHEKLTLLIHCILSHHGRIEWGSPIKPKILEAYVVHNIDCLDATLNKMGKAILNMQAGTTGWVNDTQVYRKRY